MRKFMLLCCCLLLLFCAACADQEQVPQEQPTFTAQSGETVLQGGNLYRLESAAPIIVSGEHPLGISAVSYRIGEGELITEQTTEPLTITLPAELSGSGIFSLNVQVISADGLASAWQQYLLTTTVAPLLKVYYNDELLPDSNEYLLKQGAVLHLTAVHSSGIEKICYRLGEAELTEIAADQTDITISEDFISTGSFSLNVYALAADGSRSSWQQYIFTIQ